MTCKHNKSGYCKNKNYMGSFTDLDDYPFCCKKDSVFLEDKICSYYERLETTTHQQLPCSDAEVSSLKCLIDNSHNSKRCKQ